MFRDIYRDIDLALVSRLGRVNLTEVLYMDDTLLVIKDAKGINSLRHIQHAGATCSLLLPNLPTILPTPFLRQHVRTVQKGRVTCRWSRPTKLYPTTQRDLPGKSSNKNDIGRYTLWFLRKGLLIRMYVDDCGVTEQISLQTNSPKTHPFAAIGSFGTESAAVVTLCVIWWNDIKCCVQPRSHCGELENRPTHQNPASTSHNQPLGAWSWHHWYRLDKRVIRL